MKRRTVSAVKNIITNSWDFFQVDLEFWINVACIKEVQNYVARMSAGLWMYQPRMLHQSDHFGIQETLGGNNAGFRKLPARCLIMLNRKIPSIYTLKVDEILDLMFQLSKFIQCPGWVSLDAVVKDGGRSPFSFLKASTHSMIGNGRYTRRIINILYLILCGSAKSFDSCISVAISFKQNLTYYRLLSRRPWEWRLGKAGWRTMKSLEWNNTASGDDWLIETWKSSWRKWRFSPWQYKFYSQKVVE